MPRVPHYDAIFLRRLGGLLDVFEDLVRGTSALHRARCRAELIVFHLINGAEAVRHHSAADPMLHAGIAVGAYLAVLASSIQEVVIRGVAPCSRHAGDDSNRVNRMDTTLARLVHIHHRQE